MKVFIYGYRDSEQEYFDECAKQYGMEFGVCKDAPTVQNAHLAEGYPCVSMLSTPCPAELIHEFYKGGVRFLSTRTSGFDHIDLKAIKEVGMHIGNATYAPESVADYAIMLILMALRKMKVIMKSAENQDYSFSKVQGQNLKGKTVGVLGTGNIGQTLIRHLSGFDCKILAYNPHERAELKEYVTYVDMKTLFKESDILTLHAPLNKDTYHLLNEQAFSDMKDGVVIVNTSRGGIIHNDALISAVESGKVSAAALDVIEGETGIFYHNRKGDVLVQHHMAILQAFPNVIVSPHMAFLTDDSNHDMVMNSMKSCYAFMNAEDNPWEIV